MTPDLNFTFEELKTRHKKYFVAAFSLSFFCALLPIAPIVYMRTIFGPVISSDSISYLTWLTILLIFVLAVNAILDWIRDRIIFSGVISFVNQVEERVFVTTFENETKNWSRGADTISRLRVFRNFLTSNITTAIMDTPFSIILLIAIFFIHPLMGFFSLLGALIAFSIGLLIEKKIQPVTDKAMEQNSESRKMLTEFFRDSSTLMTMGNFDRAYSRWQEINKKYLVFQARASKTQAFGSSISKVVMMVQGSMILGVGTLLTLLEIMPSSMAGNLILAKFIGALAIRPTMQVVMGWSQVVQFREVYKSLKSFLKDFQVSKESMELPNPEGHLVVNKVDYIQETSERKILDNINFTCKPGSLTAILGPSGAGKSTLCRLLVGIKSPTKGAIFLDNVPIDKWDKNSVGSHIGYSPQEHQLFEDEIAINISRYQLPDETKLKEACYLIGIPEYYQAFVEDKRLKVESDSSNLSGGMKQKISLARAFYGDPKLIVLDEPTSMLDHETKELLLGALRKFREKGSTIIIATHDKAILKTADFVLAIHGGRQKFFEEKHALMKKLSEQMKK